MPFPCRFRGENRKRTERYEPKKREKLRKCAHFAQEGQVHSCALHGGESEEMGKKESNRGVREKKRVRQGGE